MAAKKQSSSKHKASAAANAQNRAQAENHSPEAPAMSGSDKLADQDRSAGETTLAGVDRPAQKRHGKHDGGGAQATFGRTPLTPAQQSVRRAQGVSDHAE
jgi:hypothetical protein